MASEMVELIALAVCANDSPKCPTPCVVCLKEAHAAIEVIEAAGYVIAPRPPEVEAIDPWLPSNNCCLNFGCENPEVCNNEIGVPCGWPGSKEDWAERERQALARSKD